MQKTHSIGFFIKWCFDRVAAMFGLLVLFVPFVVLAILIKMDSKGPVFYLQTRIGQYGKPFRIVKFRTMFHEASGGSVTASGDPRVTKLGRWLRSSKVDSLSELFNVLIGQMSLVGPRPDVPGYADRLKGTDRELLLLKPGLTGPASLKYRHEETILAAQADPIAYNDQIIWPDKVSINLDYLHNWSLWLDIKLIFNTIF